MRAHSVHQRCSDCKSSSFAGGLRTPRAAVQVHCAHYHDAKGRGSATLAEHTPTAIHWGNAPESLPPRAFHALASGLAPRGTPHFMYLMNWDSDIKGTHVEDYGCYPVAQRKRCSDERAAILDGALAAASQEQAAFGMDKYVRTQAIVGVLPVCQAYLGRKMAATFARKHAAEAPRGVKATMAVVEPPRHRLFHRTEVVMHVKVTYA